MTIRSTLPPASPAASTSSGRQVRAGSLRSAGLLLVAGFLFSTAAAAVSEDDFEAETTRNLVILCTVSADDPQSGEAIHFCHGYLVGSFDFHEAAHSGPDAPAPLFCPPTPPPARDATVARFVQWANAHPEFMNEPPVETWFRFLVETYPCAG